MQRDFWVKVSAVEYCDVIFNFYNENLIAKENRKKHNEVVKISIFCIYEVTYEFQMKVILICEKGINISYMLVFPKLSIQNDQFDVLIWYNCFRLYDLIAPSFPKGNNYIVCIFFSMSLYN